MDVLDLGSGFLALSLGVGRPSEFQVFVSGWAFHMLKVHDFERRVMITTPVPPPLPAAATSYCYYHSATI